MAPIAASIAAFFSQKAVVATGLSILDRVTGSNDMTDKEKAEYILAYYKVTKGASPMRRLIAFVITVVWALLILTWLSGTVVNVWLEWDSLRMATNTLKIFMKDLVLEPFNLVIGFYYLIHGVSNLKNKD